FARCASGERRRPGRTAVAPGAPAGTAAGYTNSAYLSVGGSGGAVFTAQAATRVITVMCSANFKGSRHSLLGLPDIFRVHARESFDEPSGNVSLNDDLAIGGDV